MCPTHTCLQSIKAYMYVSGKNRLPKAIQNSIIHNREHIKKMVGGKNRQQQQNKQKQNNKTT